MVSNWIYSDDLPSLKLALVLLFSLLVLPYGPPSFMVRWAIRHAFFLIRSKALTDILTLEWHILVTAKLFSSCHF